jgi:hypothetical protein
MMDSCVVPEIQRRLSQMHALTGQPAALTVCQPVVHQQDQAAYLCCVVTLAGTDPEDPTKSFKLFKSFFYITHMQQSRCYETAINYWRRLRSQPAGELLRLQEQLHLMFVAGAYAG